MLTKLNFGSFGTRCAALALVAGLGLAVSGTTLVSAQTDLARIENVSFTDSDVVDDANVEVRMAVESFISGMSAKDAASIWMFASEEDQDAFGTEQAVYDAFAETFPALTHVADVNVDNIRQEGETPFVELSMTDKDGLKFHASIGLWLDDAGDWKVISLDVTPVSDRVASL